MRICHVAVGDLWAGAEVQLKVLLSKLVGRANINLSVIFLNGGRLEEEIGALGIPVRVFLENLWGNGKIFLELIRELKKSNIRIIHTQVYRHHSDSTGCQAVRDPACRANGAWAPRIFSRPAVFEDEFLQSK